MIKSYTCTTQSLLILNHTHIAISGWCVCVCVCACVCVCVCMSVFLFCPVIVCSRTCLNGGTVDTSSCTCNCAKGYTGEECGSETYNEPSSCLNISVTSLHFYFLSCHSPLRWQRFEGENEHTYNYMSERGGGLCVFLWCQVTFAAAAFCPTSG